MSFEVTKKDSNLFLFQTIEKGISQNLIDEQFLKKLQKQAVQMSFIFARRYYNVVYQAYLEQASDCVLGIMNLGLVDFSKNDPDKALKLLLDKGYLEAFQKGWSLIKKLVTYAQEAEHEDKTVFEWEKDFSEIFSARPDMEWNGHNEYLANMILFYRKRQRRNEFN